MAIRCEDKVADKFLTVNEVSDYLTERGLTVSVACLNKWRMRGPKKQPQGPKGPPFTYFGSRVFYPVSGLATYIAERTVTPEQAA